MNRKIRAAALFAASLIGLSAAGTLPAAAITGGTPDGNDHPNVAMILYYDGTGEDARYRCSATLVSSTVLLTAAHCTDGTAGRTLVTFDSVIAEQPPSGLPDAVDPIAGYTEEELEAAGYLSGTAFTHPEYSDFTDLDTWNDLGVVVLDEPIFDIEPAEIAPEGTLDPLKFNKTIFEVVGYGTEVRQPETGPQKPTPQSYPLIRRQTTSPGQKLDPQVFQLQGNPNDNRGGGGTCFGDSGGPVFLGGQIVGVTSYGLTSNCRYIGGYQRVDIDASLDWLKEFGLQPAA
ncbi:S1 family peptidase [Herbiconiux sp. SYSU D00978]|uniref:S1 family peptidase n=1 Tax=Herbiconiux sp. SYSU D00978 TaxID=2812562 RepID=UPI001A95D074|nr:trypsin-like serine protease [Herbiconiux sp. SYSU D00978]